MHHKRHSGTDERAYWMPDACPTAAGDSDGAAPLGNRSDGTHTPLVVDGSPVTGSPLASTGPAEQGVESDENGATPAAAEGIGLLETLRLGVVGGTVATVVMTLFRMPITDSLPPTAQFWARFVGDQGPGAYPLQAFALHLCYGMSAGVAFATVFVPRASGTDVQEERRGTVWATLFALLLSVFGSRVVLTRLLGLELDPDERWIFHVSHVVYGLTLGAWLGSNVPER